MLMTIMISLHADADNDHDDNGDDEENLKYM